MRGRFPPLVAARQSLPKDCAPITVRFPRRITTELHVFFVPSFPPPPVTLPLLLLLLFVLHAIRAQMLFFSRIRREV